MKTPIWGSWGAGASLLSNFVLLYFPCIATIVAVRNEAGRGWALASMVYSTAVAWFVAWIVYHIALLL